MLWMSRLYLADPAGQPKVNWEKLTGIGQWPFHWKRVTQPTGLQSSPVNFHGNGLPSFVTKIRKVTLLPEKRFLYTNRVLESRHHIYILVSEAFLAERKGAFRKRGFRNFSFPMELRSKLSKSLHLCFKNYVWILLIKRVLFTKVERCTVSEVFLQTFSETKGRNTDKSAGKLKTCQRKLEA